MDFTISEKVRTIIEMVREFMKEEVYPLEMEFQYKSFKEMLPVIQDCRDCPADLLQIQAGIYKGRKVWRIDLCT